MCIYVCVCVCVLCVRACVCVCGWAFGDRSVGMFASVCLNAPPRVVFVFRLHCLLGAGRVHSQRGRDAPCCLAMTADIWHICDPSRCESNSGTISFDMAQRFATQVREPETLGLGQATHTRSLTHPKVSY